MTHPSGPKEFRTAGRARDHGSSFVERVDTMLKGIDFTAANAPLLRAKIDRLIAIGADGVQSSDAKEAKQLTKEIMSLTRDMYGLNFPGGVDTKAFRYWMVMFWAAGGAMTGAGAGAGVHKGLEFLRLRRRGGY